MGAGKTGGRRGTGTGRQAAATLVALGLFGFAAAPAHGEAVDCALTGSTLAVTLGAGGDLAKVRVNGATIEVRDGTTLQVCSGGTPTTANVDLIDIDDLSSGITTVEIDLLGGAMAPGLTDETGSSDEIEWDVNLGAGTTGTFADQLTVRVPSSSANTLTAGVDGAIRKLNLNPAAEVGTADLDVTLDSGTESLNVVASDTPAATAVQSLDLSGAASPFSGPFTAGDTLPLVRPVFLSAADGDDVITGSAAADGILPGGGNNTVSAAGGDDQVNGSLGNDLLDGGSGDADFLVFSPNAAGNPAATLDLAVTGAQATGHGSDTITNFEDVQGTNNTGGDTLSGTSATNTLIGLDGPDTLDGRDGNDTVQGDKGPDILTGGPGDDLIRGGSTSAANEDATGAGVGIGDSASYSDAPSAVTVTLNTTSAQATGGAGTDTFNNSNPGAGAGQDAFVDIENLIGSPAGDTLTGHLGPNSLDGRAGNDTLIGLAGNDTLLGGLGDDLLRPGGGTDVLNGGTVGTDADGSSDTVDLSDLSAVTLDMRLTTAQSHGGGSIELRNDDSDSTVDVENISGSPTGDTLTGDARANALGGGDGDDVIDGGDGADILTGGAGSGDVVSYASTASPVTVNLANALLNAGPAALDTLSGFEHATGTAAGDRLVGDTGANTLSGGDGADELEGGAGADLLQGGDATDTASYTEAPGAVTVDLAAQTAAGAAGDDTLAGVESATGGAGADTLRGSTGANALAGGDGDDTLVPRAGNDSVAGGGGADTVDLSAATDALTVDLGATAAQTISATEGQDTFPAADVENATGGAQGDTLIGTGAANRLTGGAGADTLAGLAGDDELAGGDGTDTASYAAAAGPVAVALGVATPQITLAAGTDTLSSIERLVGSVAGDTLVGSAGDDTLEGGGGDDVLDGLAGADALRGGDGADRVSYASATAPVSVSLAVATAQATGGGGSDTLPDGDVEGIIGSASGDSLTGNAGANALDGGGGGDEVIGGTGNDTLTGGSGADSIDGGTGDDAIFTRDGEPDAITCGTGNDTVEADPLDTLAADCETKAVAVFVPPGAGGGAAADTTAPVLSGFSLTRSVKPLKRGGPLVTKGGAVLKLKLSEPATVTFTVSRVTKGRRSGARCVKPSAKNRKAKACDLLKKAGTFSLKAEAGSLTRRFSGRVGGKALKPGTYALVAVARDAAGNASKPATRKFTVPKKR